MDVFSDGYEAISATKAEHKNYKIAILDYKPPTIDGTIIAGELKKLLPNLKVIIITAFPDKSLLIKCRQFNINYILKKPLDIEKLQNIVLELLKEGK
jgi:DNA-binding NtrC family response regulator